MPASARFPALARRLCAALLAGLMLAGFGGLAQARAEVLPHSLTQEVDPKTGALTVTMRAFNGDTGVYYSVAYRARSGYAGMFGSDWGSNLEHRIVPMPDNTVVEVNGGNGPLRQYGQATGSQFEYGLETLVNASLGVGGGSPAERMALKIELANALEYRVATTEIYGVHGVFATGATLTSLYYIQHPAECCSTLIRLDPGWGWELKWGTAQNHLLYNEVGQIVSNRSSALGENFEYHLGRLSAVCSMNMSTLNCLPRRISFTYLSDTLIADSETGERVTYVRNGSGRLVSVEHSNGTIYRFRYDARGNIVAILLDQPQGKNVLIFTYDKADRVLTVGWESTGVFARYSY